MSDYLSNLAARTLGTAPIIQPRLPSLFESAAPSHSTQVEVAVQQEATTQAARPMTHIVPQPLQPSVDAQPLQVATQATESRSARFREAERPPAISDLGRPKHGERQDDSAAKSGERIEVRISSPIPADARPNQPSRATEVSSESRTQNRAREEEPKSEWPELQPTVQRLIADRLAEFRPAHARAGKPADKPESAEKVAAPIVPTALGSPVATREVIVREHLPPIEAPPPISVTIGRVDVRAVFAPAAPPTPLGARESQAKPASLDEYLKKRSGVSR